MQISPDSNTTCSECGSMENFRKNNKIAFQFYITKKKSIEMTLIINNKNVYDINTEHI
jgi:hypothetical protein